VRRSEQWARRSQREIESLHTDSFKSMQTRLARRGRTLHSLTALTQCIALSRHSQNIHVSCSHCAPAASNATLTSSLGTQFLATCHSSAQWLPFPLYTWLPVESHRFRHLRNSPCTLPPSLTALSNAKMTIPHAPHSNSTLCLTLRSTCHNPIHCSSAAVTEPCCTPSSVEWRCPFMVL
jgi:hypothetical protein